MEIQSAPPEPRFCRAEAAAVAKEIYERLLPSCERLKVAGSLRRGRPQAGDIEFLFIPKRIPETDLFGEPTRFSDLADVMLDRWLKEGKFAKRVGEKGTTAWGPLNKLAVHTASGIPVDFFSTTPEKWWVALVIRTGGKRMNLELTMGANRRGLTLHACGNGFTNLKTGESIICHSEEDVFRHAGVAYREPKFRP